ncbi:hypothetical protein BH18ACT5_BH18ACT5_09250 [soil metagenome]
MERTKRIAAVLVAAGVLVGCASGDEPETTATAEPASAETSLTLAISTTVRPTTTTLPVSGLVQLESTHYPYALTLPAEEILRPFQPATIAWDGKSRVIRDTPFLDALPLSDGFVFILGIEWPDDVESLAQMFVDHGEQQNSCSQAKNQRDVTVGGASAVVFTVDSCGFGNENVTFVRLAALHDGFGLIAFTETLSGQENADIDRLIERLSGLEWRTG